MRTSALVTFSLRAARTLAWLLLFCAAGLFLFEESGLLTRVLRARAELMLGSLADELVIENAHLRWFEPGIVIEGVELRTSDPEAEELLRLDSLHLGLDWRFTSVDRIRVSGGRILIGERLLDRWARRVPPRRRRVPDLDRLAPEIDFSKLEIAFELPDRTALEIAQSDLTARPSPAGGFELSGRLFPRLAGAFSEPAAIHATGRLSRSRFLLSASAFNLPLRTAGIQDAQRAALPIEDFSGLLTLDSAFELSFAPGAAPRGRLRASIRDGRLAIDADHPRFEDLDADLDATFHPAPSQPFWHRDAWTSRGQVDARWNGTPVSVGLEFGDQVEGEDWVRAWLRASDLDLDPSSLPAPASMARILANWRAFSPQGRADCAAEVRARWAPELEPEKRVSDFLLRFSPGGRGGLTFLGLPLARGPQVGFALPVRDVRGELVVAVNPDRPRPWRLAGIELEGDHGSGKVSGWTQLAATSPDSNDPRPEFDLVLSSPGAAIDERLRAAFEGNRYLRWIWSAFSPSGGRVAADWRMRAGPETAGVTAAASIRVQGSDLVWSELPVPLRGVDGRIEIVWAARPSILIGRDGDRRPIGVTYELYNDRQARTGAQAHVRGFARDESLPSVVAVEDLPAALVQEIDVEIDQLLLRGSDFDVLAARFPELGRQVEDLRATGWMKVSYHGSRPHPRLDFGGDIEAAPDRVEVTPLFFQRRTRELQGRILIQSFAGAAAGAHWSLAGNWPGEVELAVRGSTSSSPRAPQTAPTSVQIFGAGIDPTNTAFKGALVASLARGEGPSAQGFDFSNLSFAGPVDFALDARLDPAAGTPLQSTYRVYLRDNDLETRNLRLQSMHGTFEKTQEVLTSPHVLATLEGHPLELKNVRIFPLEAARKIEEADPLLLREGFWKDPKGSALQADLYVMDLPLDVEHLSSMLGDSALGALRENDVWRGMIDVLGARVVITDEAGDTGKVAMRGTLRPHDLAMRLGLPISVSSADVKVEELVVESGRFRGWGKIRGLDARIAERELTDASMIAGYVDGRLSIENLSGDFEGGVLESLGGVGFGARKALGIDLADPHRFDVAVRLRDVHVDRLMRGIFQSSLADRGILNASLQMSGTPSEILGLTGRGSLHLDDGSLWSIPVMRELFSQLGFDRTGVFDRMRARFELRDGELRISHLEIKSDFFDLVGSGWQDLDGALAYDLEVRYGLLDRLGVFNRLLYWLNNNLWRVAVRGDFVRPRVTIRNSLLEIVRGFDERPPRNLPLPEFSGLGPRF